jgi:ABC-2 type transport system ATP-binding protein
MIWFCGGHGACFTDAGPSGFVEDAIINWFARYLKRRPVDTGSRFQWIADDGQLRTANDFPLPVKQLVTGTGSGTLAFTPDATGSGTSIAATPGTNAARVPIPAPPAGSQIVGAPKLTIAYSGLANQTSVLLYAQIVDNKRHVVVGNVVTPFRVVLDGGARTATVSLEDIAASVDASSSYTLEIVPYTAVYGPQRSAGAITMTRIDASLPVVSTP